MTLRQLVLSVDKELFARNPLYLQILNVKPEYGSGRTICIRQKDNVLTVSNVHIGSLGDIVTYNIAIEQGVDISNEQLLYAIIQEMSRNGFNESDNQEFWNEMDNLQKAKLLR